ncbi:MAG: HAD-superfamily hydrolase, subfamily IIA [Acetothermia bacterium 64_32]|nr:MAG: HAD-superfamily hydrolase, subfamily IIA [Acetothermia bacterium 64_32]HAF71055.1 HAD family hydrolase [Candidatus Acetothermia bacterium]
MTRGYLLDLDGTVWRGDRLVPGADEAICELRRRGRRVVFLSNKPLYSRRDYAGKLTRLGIPTSEEEVINSSFVLARHLAQEAPGAKVFPIGELPLLIELCRAGLELCEDPEKIEYVVAAFDRTFTYRKLNIAFQALRHGARFYATNPDRTCPVENGEIPDAAGVIAALEATCGRRVERVFGKPSRYMVQAALEALALPPEACAMVGDRLETDMVMAKENGLTGILTLTGVTSREDLAAAPVPPDHVIDSVAELPTLDRKLWKS